MKDLALDFLNDQVFYADMIDWVTRDLAQILYGGSDGVLLRGPSGIFAMTANTRTRANQMLDIIESSNCTLMIAHDDISVTSVKQRFAVERTTACLSSVYLGSGLPEIIRPDLHVETLGVQWLDTIVANYHMDSPSYLRQRLEAQVILGVFRDKDLLGFIGQHNEGAMGLLVILPQYRRQAIGEFLLTYLTNQLLSQQRIPYDHIIVGNQASEALQRKLGFAISSDQLCWMSLRGDRNRTGPQNE